MRMSKRVALGCEMNAEEEQNGILLLIGVNFVFCVGAWPSSTYGPAIKIS
jgi:hypothetical protein